MIVIPFRKKKKTFADILQEQPFEKEMQELLAESAKQCIEYDLKYDQFHAHLKRIVKEKRGRK